MLLRHVYILLASKEEWAAERTQSDSNFVLWGRLFTVRVSLHTHIGTHIGGVYLHRLQCNYVWLWGWIWHICRSFDLSEKNICYMTSRIVFDNSIAGELAARKRGRSWTAFRIWRSTPGCWWSSLPPWDSDSGLANLPLVWCMLFNYLLLPSASPPAIAAVCQKKLVVKAWCV